MGRPDPILAATRVVKSYGPVQALRGVDFTVEPGEIHALLGANGAGKSTLVKALAGVHGIDSGTLHALGEPLVCRNPSDALRAGITTVFQDPALLPDLTVDQNLKLGRTNTRAVREWLEWLGLHHLDFSNLVRELPLETLRMIDLARAIAGDPAVILLDEITAALTAAQTERVFTFLTEWKSRGRSAVLITHRLAEVLRICDRATILRDGRDVARLDTIQESGAGGASSVLDEHALVSAMLGEDRRENSEPASVKGSSVQSEVRLAVRNLQFRQAVRGVSLSLRGGEILGLVALEGQGQEQLFELLSGERRPTGGVMEVEGVSSEFGSPADAVGRHIALVPGDRQQALLPSLSVRQNLALTLLRRAAAWLAPPRREAAAVRSAVKRLDIDTRAGDQVGRLSGGNQQKVVIGRWLVGGFRTLLCFDPTRGIDIRTKREIYLLLKELAAEGAAILLYTSELSEIPIVCDRVLVMHGGRIADEQPADSATESTLLAAAHGLGTAA